MVAGYISDPLKSLESFSQFENIVLLKPLCVCGGGGCNTLVDWLFWALRPFETVFQSISGRLPERGRKKREMIDERKYVQTTPTRTRCKRSWSTIIQISRTPRHWKFTPPSYHRTTPGNTVVTHFRTGHEWTQVVFSFFCEYFASKMSNCKNLLIQLSGQNLHWA